MAHHVAVAAKAMEIYKEKISNQIEGFYLPIALDSVLSEVVTSPESDSEYFENVRLLLDGVGLENVAVKKSRWHDRNEVFHSE